MGRRRRVGTNWSGGGGGMLWRICSLGMTLAGTLNDFQAIFPLFLDKFVMFRLLPR